MAKKLKVDLNLFEGVKLIGLVTSLKDYRLAFNINSALNLNLSRYKDFQLEGKEGQYSWYYFSQGGNYHSITLINNNNYQGKLIIEPKIDFLLMIKNVFIESLVHEILIKLRKIDGLNMALELQISKIKNADILLEALEMHELREVLRPKKS